MVLIINDLRHRLGNAKTAKKIREMASAPLRVSAAPLPPPTGAAKGCRIAALYIIRIM